MSDVPQGPGWWQASDDKWYPPPRPTMPGEEDQGAVPSAPSGGMAPPVAPPSGPGYGPPVAPMGAPAGPMGAPSPYAGVPPAPGGGQNRTPLFVALGVVGVLAIGGIAVAATSGGDDDPTTTTTLQPQGPNTTSGPGTDGPSGPTTTSGDPSGGGGGGSGGGGSGGGGTSSSVDGLEVADSGFSNYPDEYDNTNRVSYGYIIENNGDEPVANVEITVTLKDAEGTVVSSDTDNIYLINPGQRVGLGDEPYEEIATVDSIEVQAAIPSYASDASELGEITVDGISTTEDSGRWVTTFTASSTYEVQLDSPYAYAVYRNSAGDIVGGSYGFMNIVQAGGSTSGEVSSYNVIPDVDPAQTEVFVDPGYLF